ncbi:hypothetical protein ACFWM7_26480 [Streptomyces sp. NPDC058375]
MSQRREDPGSRWALVAIPIAWIVCLDDDAAMIVVERPASPRA